jgi:DNA polymerase-3 subunit alpha
LLSEILEKRVKSFTIQLPLPALSDDLVSRIQTIVSKYPGGTSGAQLKFTVMDTGENLKVELPSRKVRVKVENELFNELDAQVPEAGWKLN